MNQQENIPNKPVHLIYLCFGVVLFFVAQWTLEWLFATFNFGASTFVIAAGSFVLAAVTSVVLYRRDSVYGQVDEVAQELNKVTWPTYPEVKINTIVVIAVSVISAVIMGIFDFSWHLLTRTIYGG